MSELLQHSLPVVGLHYFILLIRIHWKQISGLGLCLDALCLFDVPTDLRSRHRFSTLWPFNLDVVSARVRLRLNGVAIVRKPCPDVFLVLLKSMSVLLQVLVHLKDLGMQLRSGIDRVYLYNLFRILRNPWADQLILWPRPLIPNL